MKQLFPLLVFLLFLIHGCTTSRLNQIQTAANDLSRELVADQRTDRCSAEVLSAGRGVYILKGEVLSAETGEQLLTSLRRVEPAIIDSVVVLPSPELGDKNFGLVSVSVANLRIRPDHSSELVTQAVMGTPLRVLKKKGDWLYVQTPDRYLSWTNTSSVVRITPAELDRWRSSPRLITLEHYGVVYADTLSRERLSDLTRTAILEGSMGSARWLEVTLPDGRRGWAERAFFSDFNLWKEKTAATEASVMSTVWEYTGIPYMWGGTSSKALDCSGFTRMVWFLNGIILERDASQQFKHGEVIDAGDEQENLLPGDLLFFGRKDPLRIVHVGIYLGNRDVIHAAGVVGINSMDKNQPHFSSYLAGTWVGSRRVLGMGSQFGYTPVREHPWY